MPQWKTTAPVFLPAFRRLRLHPGDSGFDFSRLRKSPEFFFGEDQRFVGPDFKYAPQTLDQFGIGSKSLFEVGRQTGGPGLVVSGDAVFDGEVHGDLFFVFLGGFSAQRR
jgi:hypothetical protein